MAWLNFAVVILLSLACTSCQLEPITDMTLRRGEMGADVVRAVQAKLDQFVLFADQSQVYELFIREAAYVESRDGAENHDGGIWRVSRDIFDQTQRYNLPELYDGISNAFCFNWMNVQYEQLRTPLHSGIAIHIHLHYLYNTSRTRLQATATDTDKAMFWVTVFGEVDRNETHWLSRIDTLRREEGKFFWLKWCTGSVTPFGMNKTGL